jgi:hypothetical protein
MYIVIDNKGMVVSVPLDNPDTINDIIMLSTQQECIQDAIKRLKQAQKEHKLELDLLVRRTDKGKKKRSK